MRVVEGDPASILNCWPLLLDTDSIKSVGVAWLFKKAGAWRFLPRITDDVSLFYNAIFFLRLNWPLGVFMAFRWSASTTSRALLQFGAGWKLNGRLAMLVRIQSDVTSAAGSAGPNYGQATGFDFGTH